VRADKLVNDVIVGEYRSVFKGRGMEFDEVREYIPATTSARSTGTSRPHGWAHVSATSEEREMTASCWWT